MKELKLFLYPLACIYGLITYLRNKAYDWGIFRSYEFPIPIISLGNLSMGGTGKTPHVEYLIELLGPDNKIATLSRGYKRLTKGFKIADQDDNSETIGDEPMQFFKKYPDIIVAVDEDRKDGIEKLTARYPDLDIILMDDAFQHRKVKPGLSIILTDYHQPFYSDLLFPSGMLRERKSGKKRADIIVVTKTPKVFSPITKRTLEEKIKPLPYQTVHYSYLKYPGFVPVTASAAKLEKTSFNTIMLLAGIANPYPLEEQMKNYCEELQPMFFQDHHQYTLEDAVRIKESFHNIVTRNKALFTTEKDMMRLMKQSLFNEIADIPVFYAPIAVDFHECSKLQFNTLIFEYVKKAKRNH